MSLQNIFDAKEMPDFARAVDELLLRLNRYDDAQTLFEVLISYSRGSGKLL